MSTESRPISEPPRSGPGPGCLRVFFLPFLLAGLGFFYAVTLKPLMRIREARSWEAVPCQILSSAVERHRGSKSTTYSVNIAYAYAVGGQRYESRRYDFFTGSSSGYDGKARIVASYPPGSQAVCYVSPANPSDAVINREPSAQLWFGAFALLFVGIGLGGVIYAPSLANAQKRRGPVVPAAPIPPSAEDHALLSGSNAAFAGRTPLRASSSPGGKLVGTIFFALFWNGIVSVFVWDIAKGFRRGSPEWFLTIFMIPFVVIGLGALGAVLYFLLALMNPRPRLAASRSAVPLGESFDIHWEFTGRSTRIRKLTITLEGVEESSYTRGTTTSTDRSVFAQIPLVEETDPGVIRSGEAQGTVPADLMHSFNGGNNKILWRLRLRGEVPRFPDVDEAFPMAVLPRTGAAVPAASV